MKTKASKKTTDFWLWCIEQVNIQAMEFANMNNPKKDIHMLKNNCSGNDNCDFCSTPSPDVPSLWMMHELVKMVDEVLKGYIKL